MPGAAGARMRRLLVDPPRVFAADSPPRAWARASPSPSRATAVLPAAAPHEHRPPRRDWTDPAAIGYPLLLGRVLLGSIVPVVPTGAVVGAAAAIATTTGRLWLPAVILLVTAAALVGDLITSRRAARAAGRRCALVARGRPRSGSPRCASGSPRTADG